MYCVVLWGYSTWTKLLYSYIIYSTCKYFEYVHVLYFGTYVFLSSKVTASNWERGEVQLWYSWSQRCSAADAHCVGLLLRASVVETAWHTKTHTHSFSPVACKFVPRKPDRGCGEVWFGHPLISICQSLIRSTKQRSDTYWMVKWLKFK